MSDTMTTVAGEIADVFAHRFTVRTAKGVILADIGPKGADTVLLKSGDRVELEGEQKPSELKVGSIVLNGHRHAIEHGKKDHGEADATLAREAVLAKGFEIVGEPRRKPKHFEIIGRGKDGKHVEHHVAFDGTIRKSQPAAA